MLKSEELAQAKIQREAYKWTDRHKHIKHTRIHTNKHDTVIVKNALSPFEASTCIIGDFDLKESQSLGPTEVFYRQNSHSRISELQTKVWYLLQYA